MKITKQDEYGLRILLRIARADDDQGLTIAQLSALENMSKPYAGKVTRMLRLTGYIRSTRGQKGGYVLAFPATSILIKNVLTDMGSELFAPEYCKEHRGPIKLCTRSVDCSIRSLWKIIQLTMDEVLDKVTLADLIGEDGSESNALDQLFAQRVATQEMT